MKTLLLHKINECDSLNGLHCFPGSHCILTCEQFSNYNITNVNSISDDKDDNDFASQIPSKLLSQYFSVNSLQKHINQKNLNIFHSNANGLESKFENLNNFHLTHLLILI